MRPFTKRNIVIIGAGVVLVAAISWYFLYSASQTKTTPSDNTKTTVKVNEDSLYADIKKAKAKLDAAKTDNEKAAAYTDLSNLYVNTVNEKSVGVDYAQKLVSLKANSINYAQLGFAYSMAGDNQKAADAYQKAADLSANKVDDGRSDYSYYLLQAKTLRSE